MTRPPWLVGNIHQNLGALPGLAVFKGDVMRSSMDHGRYPGNGLRYRLGDVDGPAAWSPMRLGEQLGVSTWYGCVVPKQGMVTAVMSVRGRPSKGPWPWR